MTNHCNGNYSKMCGGGGGGGVMFSGLPSQ